VGRLREMETSQNHGNRSFSSAARDLNIGQPRICKIIANLEDRLGVRLLVRSTRKLSPTAAGVAFSERAVRSIAEANQAEAVAQGVSASLGGRLRIAAPVTLSSIHLVPKPAPSLPQTQNCTF
jgi:DNA-binding transcriptional LysR family regulator